jgi:hypothetical protein
MQRRKHENFMLLLWGGMNFGCSHCVLIKFSMGSQSVPQHVPNSSSLYPVSFALSSTLTTKHRQAQRRRDPMISTLGLSKARYFILFYWDGPIKDAHHKRGKNEPLRMPATNEDVSQYIVA